jgi:hypothetical protein
MGGDTSPLTKLLLGLGKMFTVCIYISDILIMCSKSKAKSIGYNGMEI